MTKGRTREQMRDVKKRTAELLRKGELTQRLICERLGVSHDTVTKVARELAAGREP